MTNLTNSEKAEVAIKNLKAHGYVNVEGVFESNAISKVKLLANELLSNETNLVSADEKNTKKPWRSYMHSPKKNTNGVLSAPMLGQTQFLDKFSNQLFEQPVLKNIISKIVGKDFKIYTISIRSIDHQCLPLGLHQDNFGSLTMSIPLQEVTKNSSTTAFIPGTHLVSKCISNKLFWIPLIFFKPFLEYHRCEVGDVGFFFNKTFHGVDIKPEYSTAILINIVAAGYSWTPWELPKQNNYGKPFKKMLDNSISAGLDSDGNVHHGGSNFFSRKFSTKNSESKVQIITSCVGHDGRSHTHISNEFSNETGTYLQLLGENLSDGAFSRWEMPIFINILLVVSSIREKLKSTLKMLRSLANK